MTMFRLDDAQGRQLEAIMLATRPDWAPRNPGRMLRDANSIGFLFAADFAHMIRALAVYATMPDSHGQPFGRSPDGYTKDGHHWTSTAPQGFEKPRGPRCKIHTTFYEPCPCCAADRKAEHHDPYRDATPDPRWVKETT
jgi:hypothetical protein